MADIKRTLPPSVGRTFGIGAILDSIDGELNALEKEARAACGRLTIKNTDEAGAVLWEKELGLEHPEELSLQARKALLRLALERRSTCTPQRLREDIGRMLKGEVTVTEDFAGYALQVHAHITDFTVPSMEAVERTLRKLTPAHLACTLRASASLTGSETPGRLLHAGVRMKIYTTEESAE